MSFSFDTKNELCRLPVQRLCCARAEAYGILLYCNTFHSSEVRVVTENPNFAARLPRLFHRAFGLRFDRQPEPGAEGKLVFQITDRQKIAAIMESFGFAPKDTLALHINLPVVEEDCCKAAFLRGAFLAGGSVTSPSKAYHLEFTTTHLSVARECEALIHETVGFPAKAAARGGAQVLYLKHSDLISDFLTFLGAPVAAIGIMEAKLEKELNNKVNRCCNCDDANTSKVVEAAQEQLVAIRVLRDRGLLEKLPQKIAQAAQARENNPEASLSELAAMMEPPITKPAMNHRLQRIVSMAKEVTQ